MPELSHQHCKDFVLSALTDYWKAAEAVVQALPVKQIDRLPTALLPARLVSIELPVWGADAGVDGSILVPAELAAESWEEVDWWCVAFWYLSNRYERAHEQQHGTIHSYSIRLRDWDARIWEHAWVNRIAIFLRSWAFMQSPSEAKKLSPLPPAQLYVTHDLDAIEKTIAIRLKQTAFLSLNSVRSLLLGRFNLAISSFKKAVRFFFSRANYWQPEKLKLPEVGGFQIQQLLNIYAGIKNGFSVKRWLFDPGYNIVEIDLQAIIKALPSKQIEFGMHQSFAAWEDTASMAAQKQLLETQLKQRVLNCRQHWLRFAFAQTWKAQEESGFSRDFTLGFNDCPGFRSSSALCYSPPTAMNTTTPHKLKVIPTVLMDSHVFDYQPMDAEKRQESFDFWLKEITAVGGCAAVIWHPHTLNEDYGWEEGFEQFKKSVANIV